MGEYMLDRGVVDLWLSRAECIWLLGVLPDGAVKDRLNCRIDDYTRRGVL